MRFAAVVSVFIGLLILPTHVYAQIGGVDDDCGLTVTDCQAGTYFASSFHCCYACYPGQYQDLSGQTECKYCSPGFTTNSLINSHTTIGATAVEQCCPQGSDYSDIQLRCVCQANKYGDPKDATETTLFTGCLDCPRGMIISTPTPNLISDCYCPDGWGFMLGQCRQCWAGKYMYQRLSDDKQTRECIDCEKGKYNNGLGSIGCSTCEHGKFSSNTGALACDDCLSGTYSNSDVCYDIAVEDLDSTDPLRLQGGLCSTPDSCTFPGCHDSADDCRACGVGKQPFKPTAGSDDYGQGYISCGFCVAGTEAKTEGFGVCTECEVGKYQTGTATGDDGVGVCVNCPDAFEDNNVENDAYHPPRIVREECLPCNLGYTHSEDRDTCELCHKGFWQPEEIGSEANGPDDGSTIAEAWWTYNNFTGVFNPFTDQTLSKFNAPGCKGCNGGLTKNRYMRTDLRECAVCPSGKYAIDDGMTTCLDCRACEIGKYRTGCEIDSNGEMQIGTCVPCPNCPDVNERRVNCKSDAGYNDASGICLSVELLEVTPQCPNADGSQLGLGGFSFVEIFGQEHEEVEWQCSRPCDGTVQDGKIDTKHCGGPYACGKAACSMGSDDRFGQNTYRQAQGCTMEAVTHAEIQSNAVEEIKKKINGECQDCDTCQGRGCAQECSQLLCESGEIWDFTETTTLNKCKLCAELKNPTLCHDDFREGLTVNTVSGNRAKFIFNDCVAKGQTLFDTVTAHYGECRFCPEFPPKCTTDNEYHASCQLDIGCVFCDPHGSVKLYQAEYYDSNGNARNIYCQVAHCQNEKTGVGEWGTLCDSDCGEACDSETEIELPCLLPHRRRCISAPVAHAGQTKKDHVPSHANVLEYTSNTPHLYANFENLLIELDATADFLFQCVWNVVGVTDNDMNPGGVSHTFLRPARVYSSHHLYDGSKFCGVWNRAGGLEYPLLPLQNSVLDLEPEFPRRVLINTTARVMHYDYTGEGYQSGDYNVNDVNVDPGRPPFSDFVGDLFLNLDTDAPQVTVMTHLPTDRNLDSVNWVSQWDLSVLARDSTKGVSESPFVVSLGMPAMEEKLRAVDMTLLVLDMTCPIGLDKIDETTCVERSCPDGSNVFDDTHCVKHHWKLSEQYVIDSCHDTCDSAGFTCNPTRPATLTTMSLVQNAVHEAKGDVLESERVYCSCDEANNPHQKSQCVDLYGCAENLCIFNLLTGTIGEKFAGRTAQASYGGGLCFGSQDWTNGQVAASFDCNVQDDGFAYDWICACDENIPKQITHTASLNSVYASMRGDLTSAVPGPEESYNGEMLASPASFGNTNPAKPLYVSKHQVSVTPGGWPTVMLQVGVSDPRKLSSDISLDDVPSWSLNAGVIVSIDVVDRKICESSVCQILIACYATESIVTWLWRDDTGVYSSQEVKELDSSRVVRSVDVWEMANGNIRMMVTIHEHDVEDNFKDSVTEVFTVGFSGATLDTDVALNSRYVVTSTSQDSTIWTLETAENADLIINQYTEEMGLDVSTEYNSQSFAVVTSESKYQTQKDTLITVGPVLAVKNNRVFVLAPVISDEEVEEVTLLMRMYVTDGSVVCTVDLSVPSAWSFYRMLQGHVSYTSHAWRDDSTVVLGHMGQFFSASCSNGLAVISRVEDTFLDHTHFASLVNGFLVFGIGTVQEATSSCEAGYERVELNVETATVLTVDSALRCAYKCSEDATCTAYYVQDQVCKLVTTVVSGSRTGCRKLVPVTTRRLLSKRLQIAPVSTDIKVMVLLRDFDVYTDKNLVGYYAFTADDDLSGVTFSKQPYVERDDGELRVWDANKVDELLDLTHHVDTIQMFKKLFLYDGSELDISGVSVELELGANDLAMTFALGCNGKMEIGGVTIESSACITENILVRQQSGEVTVFPTTKLDLHSWTPSSPLTVSLYVNVSLISLHEIRDLSDGEAMAMLTSPHVYSGTMLTDQWQRVSRYVPAHVIKTVPKPSPVTVDIVGGDTYQRSVAIDALQLRPMLTRGNAEKREDSLLARLYVPTETDLEELDLRVVLQGSNAENWERLHVTVGVQGDDGCEFRVSMQQIDENGYGVNDHVENIRELGCSTSLVRSGWGECQIQVPTSLADTNSRKLVGLTVRHSSDGCQATDLQAWIAPMTVLYQCKDDEFWSENQRACTACQANSSVSLSACDPGKYIPGCDILANMHDDVCQPCLNDEDKTDFNEWVDGETCVLQCKVGYYGDGKTCQPCTEDKKYVCRTNLPDPLGYKWSPCNRVNNEKCVACDPIEKGVFSQNEEYVAWDQEECQTTCKSGFYRDLEPPYYCRPCDTFPDMLAEATFAAAPNTFHRFKACSDFSNSQSIACQAACTDCSDNEYEETGCTPSADRVCKECRECKTDEYETQDCVGSSNRECSKCLVCGIGETESVACGVDSNRQCEACADGSFKTISGSEACTPCGSSCADGQFEASPCTATTNRVCQECAVCDAGQFKVTDCDSASNSDTVCSECSTGTVMETSDHLHDSCDSCIVCNEYQYQVAPCTPTTQTVCASCPANAVSSADSRLLSDCHCLPGFVGSNGDDCVSCSDGTYKSEPGNASCVNCDDVVCPSNQYRDGCGGNTNGCVSCPTGMVSDPGSTSVGDCVCDVGTEAYNATMCIPCDYNKFRELLSDPTCTSCGANAVTSSTGSTSAADCICAAGYVGVDCTACEVGFYTNVPGASVCKACQAYATTFSTASNTWQDCTCLSGYERYGDGLTNVQPRGVAYDVAVDKCCLVCDAGTYLLGCNETHPGTCTSCDHLCMPDAGVCQEGVTFTSPVGSMESTGCQCVAGYGYQSQVSGSETQFSCNQCPSGKFSTGTTGCVDCGTGKYSHILGAGACTNCPAGKFSDAIGNTDESACTPCPDGTASGDGAAICTACTNGLTFKVVAVSQYTANYIHVGDVFQRTGSVFHGNYVYPHPTSPYTLHITFLENRWFLHQNTTDPFNAVCSKFLEDTADEAWMTWSYCLTLEDGCREGIAYPGS